MVTWFNFYFRSIFILTDNIYTGSDIVINFTYLLTLLCPLQCPRLSIKHLNLACPNYVIIGDKIIIATDLLVYTYCSVPGKHPLPGKCPCAEFQGVTVAASIQTYGIYIPGKRLCGPKSLVMFKRPWALTRDTTVLCLITDLLLIAEVEYWGSEVLFSVVSSWVGSVNIECACICVK